ncbi:OsmC family protein [Spirochaetota bacterium]
MAEKTLTVEASMGDVFEIKSKIGNHDLIIKAPNGMDKGVDSFEYMFICLAGCVASVAKVIAADRNINANSLKLTVKGNFDADSFFDSVEGKAGKLVDIIADFDADITTEEKRSFLSEVDASMRSLFHKTQNKYP